MLLADDLVDQVRDQVDEANVETVSDSDILQALNRGQDYAADILARHYEEPLLVHVDVALESGVEEYDIPGDAFEGRLEKVEVNELNIKWEVQRISYRDISIYETTSKTPRPYYYAIVGNKFRLVPRASSTASVRIWYLKVPERLVVQQGRVEGFGTDTSGSPYVLVDAIGSDLTTEIDNLNSFANVIDGQTGVVKATLQIKNLKDSRISFKTTPGRAEVQGKTVVGALPSDIATDDYITLHSGTCIPFLRRPLSNFLIQYAVAEITRRLGGSADMEYRVLKDFEQQVERTWVGREQSLRVSKRSKNWQLPFRRYFTS